IAADVSERWRVVAGELVAAHERIRACGQGHRASHAAAEAARARQAAATLGGVDAGLAGVPAETGIAWAADHLTAAVIVHSGATGSSRRLAAGRVDRRGLALGAIAALGHARAHG